MFEEAKHALTTTNANNTNKNSGSDFGNMAKGRKQSKDHHSHKGAKIYMAMMNKHNKEANIASSKGLTSEEEMSTYRLKPMEHD